MDEQEKSPEHINDILFRVLNRKNEDIVKKFAIPPYESPIEDVFAEHCFKYLSNDVTVEKQVEVITNHGRFRIDFVLTNSTRRIAIECDGKEFHEFLRDELRDGILLGENHYDTIYHFRGCDLVYYPYDCIWLISILDKDIINRRGHLHLVKLREASFEVSNEKKNTDESFMFDIDPPKTAFWAYRRSLELVTRNPKMRYYWQLLYQFACEYPRASLDELLDIEEAMWAKAKNSSS